jgi:hypothetical protein
LWEGDLRSDTSNSVGLWVRVRPRGHNGKVVVEEGNGVGFILEAGSRPTRVGRGRAARALEQLGLQGPYARRFPVRDPSVS